MRKFTLLTAFLALFAIAANADTKIIYQDNYADKATSMANWSDNRSGGATDFISTPDGNYMQFNLGLNGNNFNGTRFYSIWGATPWEGITLPETGYTMTFSFNFEQFGNNSSNAAQRNNEIAVINTDEGKIDAYWGDAGAETSYPNYLFKLTQIKTGDVAGEGGYATAVNGTCGFYINDETDLVTVAAATWYKLTLEVTGQTVKYEINDISGTPLKSGSYTLAEGIDNRAGGILVYAARYQAKTDLGLSLQISMESDDPVANVPTVTLNQVKGNDRVYKAVFAEGETLHYILPGGEEQDVDYWDAEDEDGNAGTMMLTATQSGTLKVWTEKGEAKSDDVNIKVTAGWIKLVDPVVAIASVSEGYGKTYRVTFDDAAAEHLLPVSAAITYSIDGVDQGEVKDNTITMENKGTLVVTVNQIPVGGVEWYERSSVTVNNNTEYKKDEAKSINFAHMTADELTAAGFAADEIAGGNWASYGRLYGIDAATAEAENPTKIVYNEIPQYTKKSTSFTDGTMFGNIYCIGTDPAVTASTASPVNVHIWQGVGMNVEGKKGDDMSGSWIGTLYFRMDGLSESDFIAVYSGGNYGNSGKDSNHPLVTNLNDLKTQVTTTYNLIENTCTILKSTEPIALYRVSDAIGRIDVFSPVKDPTGIETVKTVAPAVDANAPIYNLNGVRVANAAQKGIYIQNGKKFVVK